jgi:DNA-binding helix-hairpin-helix protein with protein kinase domain
VRIRRQSTGQILALTDAQLLGAGGEARIFKIPEAPELVAKIWHKPTTERASKLKAMLANPPLDPTVTQQHTSIAWPTEVLETGDAARRIVGFAMPFVSGMSPIIDFFNPKTRRQKLPLFNWFYLHRTARNLAIAIRALHERDYVIGDLNESNVLAAPTALTTIVDTDSFQVWDGPRGTIYRCRVGKPEFTPPEMQGKNFSITDRTAHQDAFPLGILIFELLMEGTHPYAGTFKGQGEAPPYEQRISAGHFPYSYNPNTPYTPKTIAPPFEMLHPTLQHLFMRCFVDGHIDPKLRPDPQAWQWALEEAETALVSCWVNDQHIYSGHMDHCPWCERSKVLGGRDPFPSVQSVRDGTHIGPAVAPPKSTPGAPIPAHRPRGPLPPIPRPIPSGSGSKSAQNAKTKNPFAALQPRNDFAWGSLGLGVCGAVLLLLNRAFQGLVPPVFIPFLCSMLGLIMGIWGEAQSHGWYLDGRGQVQARIGIVLNLLTVGWFYVAGLGDLAGH